MIPDDSIPFFTLFTPVFNAEKHIHRVFQSLLEQDCRDFEWIVINDGSTDDSPGLIKTFLKEHREIKAIFLEQPNSGKHLSWNRAVELAKGRLFVPADADDYFFPDTLSFFHEKWNSLTNREQETLSGINVLCLDNDSDTVVGDLFPEDGMIASNIELEFKHRLKGEKWGCVRTDLLKSRSFPIIKGSHFPESWIWYYFSRKYKAICYNKPLRRYYTTETGIMQQVLGNTRNPVQDRVNARYYSWLLLNFGFYIMRHAPRIFYEAVKTLMKARLNLLLKR